MKQITDERVGEIISAYGLTPSELGYSKIKTYVSLLLKWNRSVSLTTVTDPIEVLKFHFGESLFAVPSVPLHAGRLADVGSGAGFPGLPIAIAIPDLRVTLIESNLKKCAFLAEVCRTADISNAEVVRTRMESMTSEAHRFDFITARALGQFDELLSWARGHLAADGLIVLWLGESDAAAISQKPGWGWRGPVLIPASVRRYILVGSLER